MIRSFIAIEIPDFIRSQIAGLQDEMRRFHAHVSWVNSRNIHVTLKFLGDIQESLVPQIGDVLGEISSRARPFEITIENLGFFPNARRPRVLWVGVTDPQQLERLFREIEDGLSRLGFAREKRGFTPHLTIGRVRNPGRIREVVGQMQTLSFQPGSFEAEAVSLIKSTLKPTGAVYESLGRFEFGRVKPNSHEKA